MSKPPAALSKAVLHTRVAIDPYAMETIAQDEQRSYFDYIVRASTHEIAHELLAGGHVDFTVEKEEIGVPGSMHMLRINEEVIVLTPELKLDIEIRLLKKILEDPEVSAAGLWNRLNDLEWKRSQLTPPSFERKVQDTWEKFQRLLRGLE